MNGHTFDGLSVESTEVRAAPGDQGVTSQSDGGFQHRPILLRQREHGRIC